MSSGERCRRRQILDHFGDEEEGRPSGRCCDVCDPDEELEGVVRAALVSPNRKRARPAGRSAGAAPSRAGSTPPARSPEGGLAGTAFAEQELDPVDEGEFERLRAWRLERAAGKPAYTVAANSALEEILRRRPVSLEALIAIRGIGPAFCEQHGESLLEALVAL
jgi:ATP-dependent DNA helicase RecQ